MQRPSGTGAAYNPRLTQAQARTRTSNTLTPSVPTLIHRRFTHHSVDGRLLLRLTDAQLKSDMGIGPMGHRAAILDAASQLVKQYEEGQRDRMRAGDYDDGEEGGGRSGSPQRMRPSSAVTPPSGALSRDVPRRPASASRSVIPPDPFLGPAQGKQTVYEQRARLLFELDRAQVRGVGVTYSST